MRRRVIATRLVNISSYETNKVVKNVLNALNYALRAFMLGKAATSILPKPAVISVLVQPVRKRVVIALPPVPKGRCR
jgi:hypothetical protein